jgi:hypothetical protein
MEVDSDKQTSCGKRTMAKGQTDVSAIRQQLSQMCLKWERADL